MRTVHEVSKLTGVSIRTLHYYDAIGLLHPTAISESGYRLYGDTALEQLQQIMLFRELDFSAFDAKKLDEYASQAKATWGKTETYKEYEEKTKNLSNEEKNMLGEKLMTLFVEFGKMRDKKPECKEVQEQVKKLQDYITNNFYTCTEKILLSLGKMYSGGGSMTENIDAAGGAGTADFVAQAIELYCKEK